MAGNAHGRDSKGRYRRGCAPGPGRPKLPYDPAAAEAICEALAQGETLREACKPHGISVNVVYRWLEEEGGFRDRYTRAMRCKARSLMDEAVDRCRAAHDVGSASAANVQTRTLLAVAARLNPAECGEKQSVEVTEVRRLSDDELRIRLIEALAKEPRLIPLALARSPDLEPALRSRGLLPDPLPAAEPGP